MSNKKGMYFTLMAVAFLLVFIFVFMAPGYERLGKRMTVVEMRVDSMNDFIKDLERDAERGLYISSYRALLALEGYIINSGSFLDDVEARFNEALLNGTVNGVNSSLMLDSTFPLWVGKIGEEALKFHIETNITINNIGLYQSDPWLVNSGANLTFFIEDVTGIASWRIDKYIETSISIIGFEDPVYIVNSFGRTSNTIDKTPFEGNYTYYVGEWNITNLLMHLEDSYYAANILAPSFLMRFENNLSSSPYGIESLVNLKKLDVLDLDIDEDDSIVDWFYWDGVSNGDYRINFTPSWVRLDYGHLDKYEVTDISYLG